MVNPSSLVIGLLGTQNTQYELKVLEDMKGLGARVLAIGDLQETQGLTWLDHYIPLKLNGLGLFGDVLYLLPLQMLAFERALVAGNDPDHPKNLSAVVVLDEQHDAA
jgi:fructoselysine-6-P-deglycase FrlB-like protein